MASSPHIVAIIPHDQLKLLEELKDGGYGLVSKAELVGVGVVAYKELHVEFISQRESSQLLKEVGIQAKLSHENIVSVLGLVFEPKHYGLIFEYVPKGDMLDFIAEKKCDWWQKLQMIRDVASGMNYLHGLKPPIIHGDLKSENVLIDGNLRAKIADFGFSNWREFSKSKSKNEVRLGTVTHIPPENWKDPNQRKMEPFDVYGFAILMWEAMTAERPFRSVNEIMISVIVIQGHRPAMELIPENVPKMYIKLMQSCWNQCHEDRPSFTSIKTQLEAKKIDSRPGIVKKLSTNKKPTKRNDEINDSEYAVIADSHFQKKSGIKTQLEAEKIDSRPGIVKKLSNMFIKKPSKKNDEINDSEYAVIADSHFQKKSGRKKSDHENKLLVENDVKEELNKTPSKVLHSTSSENKCGIEDLYGLINSILDAKEVEPGSGLKNAPSKVLHRTSSENKCGIENLDITYNVIDAEKMEPDGTDDPENEKYLYPRYPRRRPTEPEYMNVNPRRSKMPLPLQSRSHKETNSSKQGTPEHAPDSDSDYTDDDYYSYPVVGDWRNFASAGAQHSKISKTKSLTSGCYETPAPFSPDAPKVYQFLREKTNFSDMNNRVYLQFDDEPEMLDDSSDANNALTNNCIGTKDSGVNDVFEKLNENVIAWNSPTSSTNIRLSYEKPPAFVPLVPPIYANLLKERRQTVDSDSAKTLQSNDQEKTYGKLSDYVSGSDHGTRTPDILNPNILEYRGGTSETFLHDTSLMMSGKGTGQGVSGSILPDYVPPLDWVRFDN